MQTPCSYASLKEVHDALDQPCTNSYQSCVAQQSVTKRVLLSCRNWGFPFMPWLDCPSQFPGGFWVRTPVSLPAQKLMVFLVHRTLWTLCKSCAKRPALFLFWHCSALGHGSEIQITTLNPVNEYLLLGLMKEAIVRASAQCKRFKSQSLTQFGSKWLQLSQHVVYNNCRLVISHGNECVTEISHWTWSVLFPWATASVEDTKV